MSDEAIEKLALMIVEERLHHDLSSNLTEKEYELDEMTKRVASEFKQARKTLQTLFRFKD